MDPFFYYGNSWVDETGWVSYNNSQKVKPIGRRGVRNAIDKDRSRKFYSI